MVSITSTTLSVFSNNYIAILTDNVNEVIDISEGTDYYLLLEIESDGSWTKALEKIGLYVG